MYSVDKNGKKQVQTDQEEENKYANQKKKHCIMISNFFGPTADLYLLNP
jgi:hypothetical protein